MYIHKASEFQFRDDVEFVFVMIIVTSGACYLVTDALEPEFLN